MTHGVAVRVDGATVRRGGQALLDDVGWTVGADETWAVLGPNGAGKSTLLGLLTGQVWATTGTVDVLGERLGRTDVRVLRRRVPLVSHRVADQLRARVSVRDLLRASRRGALAPGLEERRAAAAGEADDDVAAVADRLGLGALLDQPWTRCSQGERQRVLIGRALLGVAGAGAPGLLLLDEATSGLDLPGRELLLGLVEDAPAALPTAELMATVVVAHHLEDLPRTTTHALLLDAGAVVAAGPADDVLADEPMSTVFGLALRVARRRDGRFSAGLDGRASFTPP